MNVSAHYFKLLKILQLVTATTYLLHSRLYKMCLLWNCFKFKMFKSKIIFVAHIFTIISGQYYRTLIYSYFNSNLSLIIDFVACPLQYGFLLIWVVLVYY